MLDISKSPMEVAPTAHYSMGGILVDPNNLSTNIKGLFAAGEVAGGLHGANRLGGNSLAEILIFGKRAGLGSSHYSRNLGHQVRSQEAINLAHKNISKFKRGGKELVKPMQNELRHIMWEYCGVIKDQSLLTQGLQKVHSLKEKLKFIDVGIDENNNELSLVFDLQSSLISAEATIISAIARDESRGAHQRKDFKEINQSYDFNCIVELDAMNNNLKLSKLPIKKLSKKLLGILKEEDNEQNLKGKLLE